MRSAIRSSRIMSTRLVPSTYSEWLLKSRPSGLKFSAAAQLRNSLRNLVSMLLFLFGVLQKLFGYSLRVNACRHVVMTFVPQHAHQFRSQRFVQHANHGLAIGTISLRHRTILYMLPSAATDFR